MIETKLRIPEAEEIASFLQKKKDDVICNWCHRTVFLIHNKLRTLPSITISDIDENYKVTATSPPGVEGSVPAAIIECDNCGHMYFFNYFSIMDKISEGGGKA